MLHPNSVNTIEPIAPLGAFNASNFAAQAEAAAKVGLEQRHPKTAHLWKHVPLLAITLAHGVPSSASSTDNHPFVSDRSTYFSYDTFAQPMVDMVHVGSADEMSGLSNWFAAWGSKNAAVASTHFASIINELDILKDGWNGSESLAPNDYVKSDLRILAQSIASAVREPEVEVDDDGSIALRWEDHDIILALTLNGNGRVIGTMYPCAEKFPCELSVTDQDNIGALLSISEVRSVIL